MIGLRTLMGAFIAVLLALLAAPSAVAHEIRPAYLDLKETAPGRYDVLWRTPVLSGMRLPIALQMPAGLRNLRERLAALYGERAAFELIQLAPAGVRAEVRLPCAS